MKVHFRQVVPSFACAKRGPFGNAARRRLETWTWRGRRRRGRRWLVDERGPDSGHVLTSFADQGGPDAWVGPRVGRPRAARGAMSVRDNVHAR